LALAVIRAEHEYKPATSCIASLVLLKGYNFPFQAKMAQEVEDIVPND
jgi:hypothetical protein